MHDVKQFGIAGDGRTKNTQAIQKLIDQCHDEGGGIIVFGKGVYLSGPLYLRSHVGLHLEPAAVLKASTEPEDYENFSAKGFKGGPEYNSKYFICSCGETGVSISGSGTIDGSGSAFFDKTELNPKNPNIYAIDKYRYTRPARMMMFYKCRNLRFENTMFANSPGWTFWLHGCEDVSIHGIRIGGDRRVPNHDGIDIDSCRRVTVSDCIIRSGDDSIVLRAIQAFDDVVCVCEDIAVNNCILDSNTQGVRIGCPNDSEIRNCVLSNLVINSRANGISFECPARYLSEDRSAELEVHDIIFSNVIINCKRHPVKIHVEEEIKIKAIRNIRFSNFTITGDAPIFIQGDRNCAVRNIFFDNMNFKKGPDNTIIARNCHVTVDKVEISN